MLRKLAFLFILLTPFFSHLAIAQKISSLAQNTANYAAEIYQQDMVNSLKALIKYNTVAVEGMPSTANPIHIAFKQALKNQALALGFDYQDHGYVMIIGLGNSKQRVGIITHGDIQPVNATKWAKSPFELDLTSEPGKLIGRGTEDDKGPISSALYAMKAIKDKKINLKKRLELYIYMAEESDWDPLKEFIKNHDLPQTNITLDAEYPVVTAEKGYGTIQMTFPTHKINDKTLHISAFTGGFFGSQIPEDAQVIIENANQTLLNNIQTIALKHPKMKYTYQWKNKQLTITALGKSAHSSKPEAGLNAITHLAELLSMQDWPNNASGALINFVNENLGTNLYGDNFGDISYQDDFMGKMTVSPTVLKQLTDGIQLKINIRRPRGKSTKMLELQINQVIQKWQTKHNINLLDLKNDIEAPFIQTNAPHINTLLNVFSHFSGIQNAKPIAIGGGTNSRLFPNAVSFGPSMPNTEYTGHSEHEFITMKQFVLNLKMYTAVMIELAK
ncbi:dipeptidase [Pseudoalteromonas denitrificans]|uniref:Dipeptidase D n=1 Tax=Pseudoalteromonas denitrificans DSM 6059 TaxID=1123010 RepID=A0A1I1Q638_9GAMM|nr:dipeptidase [Pseudoalteromonas denitrificans]SFD14683.1 dipeptidase D [Pseudoalteromonas denitrificans DSM 6059]